MCARVTLFYSFIFIFRDDDTHFEMRKAVSKRRKEASCGSCVYTHQKSQKSPVLYALVVCLVAVYDLTPNGLLFIYCTLLDLTESGRKRERKEGKW